MDLFPFDANVHDVVSEATYNFDKATEALRLAAGYLRKHEPIPEPLATWIADAFDLAGHKANKKQSAKVLVEALALGESNRPLKSNWLTVGSAFDALVATYGDSKIAISEVMNKFGISESTAHRCRSKYRKEYKKAKYTE